MREEKVDVGRAKRKKRKSRINLPCFLSPSFLGPCSLLSIPAVRRQIRIEYSHRLETKGRWTPARTCGERAMPPTPTTRARGVMPPTRPTESRGGPRRPSPFSKGSARCPRCLASSASRMQQHPRPGRLRRRTSRRRRARRGDKKGTSRMQQLAKQKEFFLPLSFYLRPLSATCAPVPRAREQGERADLASSLL